MRARDAKRTRVQLLTAASELFAERGYDGTTTRDIGERAGADPALIARYFGSKAALYLAALRSDTAPRDLLEPSRLADVMSRVRSHGPGPVLRAAVQRHEDAALQGAAQQALDERLVAPLRERLASAGLDHPELRAEVAVAAFTGVALGRAAGSFPALRDATEQDVVALTAELLAGISRPTS
jgi:AcrR family transcriptional regulator